jgi:hypothetical protein
MKQVFATAAMAAVSSAMSMEEMYQSMLAGQSYRQRDGADDAESYQVLASSQWDDGAGVWTGYTPETGTQ